MHHKDVCSNNCNENENEIKIHKWELVKNDYSCLLPLPTLDAKLEKQKNSSITVTLSPQKQC